jgi:hypothetical protein
MKIRRVATMLILTFITLALVACENIPTPVSDYNETPQLAYAAAQATLDYGQSQIEELNYQATVVGLDIAQAAQAAAQSTLDYNQRQLMELSIQATEVSLNMARAAATQQFVSEQTQAVGDAAATSQSLATTATYSAYILSVTQTAQALAILDVQRTRSAQARDTLRSDSLTATPRAALQAEIVRTRNVSNRRAWWGEFVVTPLAVILIILVVVLLIVGGVLAYQRFMPVLELRLRTIWREDNSPLPLMDGMIVDPAPPHRQLLQRGLRLLKPPRLPNDHTVQVEIIDPSEPSVINWITEAEQKLRSDGWIQP